MLRAARLVACRSLPRRLHALPAPKPSACCALVTPLRYAPRHPRWLSTAPKPQPSELPIPQVRALLLPDLARIVLQASLGAIVVTACLLVGTGVGMEWLEEQHAAPAPGAFMRIPSGEADDDRDQVKVHYQCRRPDVETEAKVMVVLDGGIGEAAVEWGPVMEQCAKEVKATTLAVDRPGLGYSGRGRQPRTARQIAREYAGMLTKLEGPKKVVLVGHGAGGYSMRRLAELIEQDGDKMGIEVVGLVLVDALQEEFQHDAEGISPSVRKALADLASSSRVMVLLAHFGIVRLFLKRQHKQNADKYTEATLEYIESFAGTPAHCQGVYDERHALAMTEQDFREHKPHISCASVVLSHGKPDVFVSLRARRGIEPAHITAIEQKWQHAQRKLAKSVGSDSTVQMVVDDAGHCIHLEKPGAIVQAVNALVHEDKHAGDVKGLMALNGTCPI